ncbi:MAG: hypothetical protein EOS58_01755 [Mesorhizobium sp.]|uniref:hypothetical protein n=1 Tax=unclassified Mesorhizobium TaxID=325217 RepID=UPI000F75D629|nr:MULTISPECIES: hypothetical protein [unclassified Mesorhizobium]RVD73750.1 hypothetical protein EN751_03280 [Mesorhizobium sp. M4A.F.Ca.ET.029.04.2.1]AZO51394.1 hypothetical protein EJ073_29415 [Mesorhizobium sp. M4B.F.Ca.ET.058.02.1.1]RUX42348.1 hypothetical protein EOA33_32130 [Mesorhizobium sp. M4A.F.Ca.ET.050.02.1.1]RVC45351.1 hypothetical protein EN781_10255 [Mesorhizobium sp. M4A.F.Ca.ET.090.04.2.1]RVC79036.1 hypothetical protein EN745_17200 [Mesorhizobium sp. M4A.F.Ca.ET.022.05.2.1]
MSVLSSIGRIATRYAAARARYRSERILLSLPAELRKDIGVPEIFDVQNSRRARAATCSARVI